MLCRDANAQALEHEITRPEHESTRPVLSVHFNYAAGYVDHVIEWFTARTDLVMMSLILILRCNNKRS